MKKHSSVLLTAVLATFGTTSFGCRSEAPRIKADDLGAAAQASSESVSPYPRARWRLVASITLSHTVLWVSHILVRHERSSPRVPCTVSPWRTDAPRPQRTRAEALELARQIAAEAAAQPERFADLAQRHSDDVTTRVSGGSLGGVRAASLQGSPALLDALAALRPGMVSRVVETSEGFHILQRRAPPAEGRVSGEHLVIGHEGARWLHAVGSPPPVRSRSEALALANSLYAELSEHPERFTELVRRHSEHPDKIRDGDLGSWSVREPTHLERQIDQLQKLSQGQVAPPIDSSYGIEILRRSADRPRRSLAMRAVQLAYQPGDPASKHAALQHAGEWIEALRKEPARFDDFASQYCCSKPEQWFDGREEPGLSAAVGRLALGEIASAPVERFLSISIPMRIDPADVPAPPEALYELPSPQDVDLSVVSDNFPSSVLNAELDAVTASAQSTLGLSAAEQGQLHRLAAILGTAAEMTNPTQLLDFHGDVTVSLGEQRGRQYRQLVDSRLEQLLLGQARSVLAQAGEP